MDTQVADPLLGALVGGRYRVRRRISHGGAATVYSATDERLGRTVAVRTAQVGPRHSDPRPDRFADQARTIARLTHPNVVATYDQGTHHGTPYLVMEHVQGRTLREVLNTRRRLAPAEALALTEQVLAALATAHRAELVHGDLKPENVLVAESPSGGAGNLVDAVAKVGDFGLSRLLHPGEDPGTARPYAAPELAGGGPPDPRSDVYSVGVLLFEMLTGRLPFDTGNPAEVAWRPAEGPVTPPSRYAADLPPALDDLVARATRDRPEARPGDAGVLLAEVQAARQLVSAGARRPPPADSTVVLAAVPGSERPAWARLPEPGAGRAGTIVRTGTAHRTDPPARRARTVPEPVQQRRAVLLGAGALIGLLLLVGGWWFGFGQWTPVPDLRGMAEPEAVAEAQARGLDVAFDEPRHSDTVAQGRVLAQDPTDRIARGGTITLTLSLGPEVVTVPDVIGTEAEVAQRQLEALGLVVREGEPGFSRTVPAGRVLAVEPEVGTELQPGDEIVVSISEGRAPIEIPHLIGMHINEASNELQQRGLQAEVVEVDSERPGGEVLNQDPGAGAGAVQGDTVRLEISDGPSTTPVPDVMGDRCRDAERTLERAGFNPQTHGRGRDRVALQLPSAGTGLPPGSEVHIFCQ